MCLWQNMRERGLLSLLFGEGGRDKVVEDVDADEDNSLARNDACGSSKSAVEEGKGSLVCENLLESVQGPRVIFCFDRLHSRLDDVERRSGSDREETSSEASEEGGGLGQLGFGITGQELSVLCHEEESRPLVSALFHAGGDEARVETGDALVLDDVLDSVDHAHVEVDEFRFNRFLGNNGEGGFADSGTESRQKRVPHGDLARLLVPKHVLEVRVGPESDARFRNRK